jgi:hypothetical protein
MCTIGRSHSSGLGGERGGEGGRYDDVKMEKKDGRCKLELQRR